MSLTNVLLIHVSSRYMPITEEEELEEENDHEYYAVLQLPKYSAVTEIRKSYRRLTLKIQCDRMMLEWQRGEGGDDEGDEQAQAALALDALNDYETKIKNAFHTLGDKHLRQQYHLLQCRPSRYKVIKGPVAVIHGMTMSRRWFPLLVLQSVIVATMVNAVVAEYETQQWVYVLIPVFGYYGMIVLFWIYMLEWQWFFFLCGGKRRKYSTLRKFVGMLTACCQHVSLWLGCFFMARYWDRALRPTINWYILSIPFYLAILCRCYCSSAAIDSLHELQSKMISRNRLEQQQQQSQQQPAVEQRVQQDATASSNKEEAILQPNNSYEDEKDDNDTTTNNTLPEGYIVVTHDSALFAGRLLQLTATAKAPDVHEIEELARVQSSPEYRQVDRAAQSIHRAAVQLGTLGMLFVLLVSLKLEDHFDVSWWLIFTPIWIHLGMRLLMTSRAPNRVPVTATAAAAAAATATTQTPASATAAATTATVSNAANRSNNNPQSSTATEGQPSSTSTLNSASPPTPPLLPTSTATPATPTTPPPLLRKSAAAATTNTNTPTRMEGVTSKSLWKGEYKAADVVLDVVSKTTNGKGNVDENADVMDVVDVEKALMDDILSTTAGPGTTTTTKATSTAGASAIHPPPPPADLLGGDDNPLTKESSLIDKVQLALTERDVEAALPPSASTTATGISNDLLLTQSIDADIINNNSGAPEQGQNKEQDENHGGGPAGEEELGEEEEEGEVHEEFERWQSVYENQEVRTGHFQFLPCEVFFHLMIVCLIVAKLDESHENTSQEGSSFNAFYILLVPFSVGLLVCCCALAAGFLALHTEPPQPSSDNAEEGGGEGEEDGTALDDGINDDDNNVNLDELPPMQHGAKDPPEKTFARHIDVVPKTEDWTFTQRVQLLTAVLPISETDAEKWLMEKNDGQFLRSSPKTIWEQVISCADGLKCETVKTNNNGPKAEDCGDANNDKSAAEDGDSSSTVVEAIGPFDEECISLLRTNLEAHFQRAKFRKELDAIEPVPLGDDDENDNNNNVAIECLVCCEDYDIKDMVHCEGEPIHFFCRGCFHRYATETIQAGDVAGMPCADPNCPATFSTPTVRSNLSQWELLRQRDRENERNKKVALNAKAVLQCPCGAVGIVREEEVGDGCIVCPGVGCDKTYCAKCGNLWHPDTNCPPTKKMMEWVVQNTMPCPNCGTPIEKNYGCDHMHCAPPGGCGHHFSYRTGKPMSKHGRNLRGLYH